MTDMGEPEIFRKALALYDKGSYFEGYTLITEHALEYPDYMDMSFFFRLCLIARTGNLPMAEEILEDALDQGYFYSENALRKDEDLKELQGREFFERLVTRDLLNLTAAQARTKPQLQIIHPDHEPKDGIKRFVMALHGNSSNLTRFLPQWQFIRQTDWWTAIPQSSQVGGSQTYVWNDQTIAQRELKAHYQTVCKHFTPDPAFTLICGFSMGGYAALKAALEQTFPISAFLLVCPFFSELNQWIPMIESAAATGLRGYFLLGEEDTRITPDAIQMEKLLSDHGIPAAHEIFPGLRHEFPPEFEQVFDRASRYLFPEKE